MLQNTNLTEDIALLQGLKNRDDSILRKMYDLYFPSIRSFVINNNGLVEDAQDVFHDALIVVYRKAKDDSFELTSSLFTFLFSICKNLWLKKLKRNSRQSGVTIEGLKVLTLDASVLDVLEQSERFALYREKLMILGTDCQKLLQLFFDKKSMKEIALIMGFASEGYARKRKFKCKERLTELIRADKRFKELKR